MKRLRVLVSICMISIFLCIIYTESKSESLSDYIFSGTEKMTVGAHIDGIQFSHLAQFDSERIESLNKLIRHFSLDIVSDENLSEAKFYIDQNPLFSMYQQDNQLSCISVYSVLPDTAIEETKPITGDKSFSSFLEKRFFLLNRILDDLYPLFEKFPASFPDKAKIEKANLNYSGYGKGVTRMIYSFSTDEVKQLFPSCLLELTESERTYDLIKSLVFEGPQKIILLLDSDGRLLRVNYDGKVGTSEDSLRKLSVVCRSVRNSSIKKDKLTIKSPAVNGYDRDNINYERIVDLTDMTRPKVYFDYQLDNRTGSDRKKIHFYSDISLPDGSSLFGTITYDEKGTGQDKTIIIKPDIHSQTNGDYSGTLEITRKTGKIVITGISFQVQLFWKEAIRQCDLSKLTVIHHDSEEGAAALNNIRDMLSGIMIHQLLCLPKEDTDFFNHGIDDADWSYLIDTIF